jgi:hypothetical protein
VRGERERESLQLLAMTSHVGLSLGARPADRNALSLTPLSPAIFYPVIADCILRSKLVKGLFYATRSAAVGFNLNNPLR